MNAEHPENRDACPYKPECIQEIHDLRSVVFGNGKPERSLLVRMDRVESRLSVIQRISFATLCGVGALVMRIVGAWVEGLIRS